MAKRRQRYAGNLVRRAKDKDVQSKAAAAPEEEPLDSSKALAAMIPLFAALAASVNENGSDYFTFQLTVATSCTSIGSAMSEAYTSSAKLLTTTQSHRTELQTTTGVTAQATQAGNMKIRICKESFFAPALRVPMVTDNLISMRQLAQNYNLIVYL